MSTLHFMNVGNGDCTVIQHNSGRTSVIDICKGNYAPPAAPTTRAEMVRAFLDQALAENAEKASGNFGMSKKPTNPIGYMRTLGISSIFRFILTHPDMDHLDGLDAMMDTFGVANFWETGLRKEKPDFSQFGGYCEEDWDRFTLMCDGKEPGLKVLRRLAGEQFKFANQNEASASGGDGLYILAPNKDLLSAAIENGDVNDASYVLLYRSAGGRILIPGDAHDETWAYVIKHYAADVANCSVLLAPHHGRRSAGNFDFLDVVKPKLTLFGCASSGHLAYDEWSRRDLRVVTNNQAGNLVLECANEVIDVYVQNQRYATACGCDSNIKNVQDYSFFDRIDSNVRAA